MRNIDKVKEMNSQELAHLIDSNRCKICAFNNPSGNCEGKCGFLSSVGKCGERGWCKNWSRKYVCIKCANS